MEENYENNFGIKEGMKVELLTEDQSFLLNGIVDKIDGEAVWVVNSSGDSMPLIIHNTQVHIRGIRSDNSIVILHGAIAGNSDVFWKIDNLSQFIFSNQRNDYRHPVFIKTSLNRLTPFEDKGIIKYTPSEEIENCIVHNISGGGLMFSSSETFLLGDAVHIEPINLIEGQESFSMNCRVLRVTTGEKDGDEKFFYGCSFFDFDTKQQQRLIRQIFTLQAAEIRRKNRF